MSSITLFNFKSIDSYKWLIFRSSWRFYSSNKVDFNRIRPMIHNRIKIRSKDYPIRSMVPVAQEVIDSRKSLIQGVSTLLKAFPAMACKRERSICFHPFVCSCRFCPEAYIGKRGHLIQTCYGPKRRAKNRVHEWVVGGLNDILVPVETFHLREMFQDVIKHHQRFDLERVPAVVELCWQAGALPNFEDLYSGSSNSCCNSNDVDGVQSLSSDELRSKAIEILTAWEKLRDSIQKLLLVYPVKVCKYCSEVHVGPSGHRARLCGVFKYEGWRGTHFWKKAGVDDLVPPKIVWHRRRQDPLVLLNEGRDFYGHAPAVVDLCIQAGAIPPKKYHCMMKVQGLPGPV